MDEKERLESLKKQYLDAGSLSRNDIQFLFDFIDEQVKKMVRMEKKNEILYNQNLELTQEMENLRGDFGGGMR